MSVYSEAREAVKRADELSSPMMEAYKAELQRIIPILNERVLSTYEQARILERSGATRSQVQQIMAQNRALIAELVQRELTRITVPLAGSVEALSTNAIALGAESASDLISMQIPPNVFIDFARPNLAALQAQIAQQQTEPIRRMFAALGPVASERAKQILNQNLIIGKNPRETARELVKVTDLTRNRADIIARHTTLQSFRLASLETYDASDIVKEFKRLAARNLRTCIACIALDGTKQKTKSLMAVHPRDRCTVVPVLDLPGVNLPKRTDGKEWFNNLDPEQQRKMLGKSAYEKYTNGVPIERFAKVEKHKVWGPTVRIRPASEL